MNTTPINICIVDDSDVFRNAFIWSLNKININKNIYQAENGRDFLRLMENIHFDIVFMDLEMPIMNGIAAARKAIENCRGIKIIAVSFHSDFENIRSMIEAGAINYIFKDDVSREIIEDRLNKALTLQTLGKSVI